MLLHLPIVVLATLSPITVSDKVPTLDIAKECHFEGDSSESFGRCSRDESDALHKLEAEWAQFADADRRSCYTEATIDGLSSYVELLICLEMARDVRNDKRTARDATGVEATRPVQPEVSVVDKHE